MFNQQELGSFKWSKNGPTFLRITVAFVFISDQDLQCAVLDFNSM